jgi:diguanylate cyclase (GGDEF)-like protein/PAS domain S-box-containing protein
MSRPINIIPKLCAAAMIILLSIAAPAVVCIQLLNDIAVAVQGVQRNSQKLSDAIDFGFQFSALQGSFASALVDLNTDRELLQQPSILKKFSELGSSVDHMIDISRGLVPPDKQLVLWQEVSDMTQSWERIANPNRAALSIEEKRVALLEVRRSLDVIDSVRLDIESKLLEMGQAEVDRTFSSMRTMESALVLMIVAALIVDIITIAYVLTLLRTIHRREVDLVASKVDLERTQRFLNTIIENIPVAIVVKNARDQRYVLVNRATQQMWNKSGDEILGRTAFELFPEATARDISARDRELLESKQTLLTHSTHQVETAEGAALVVTKRVAILDEGGEPQYLLGVIEDVTERARSEERISYMAHHDLLTGLGNRALFMEKIEDAGARLRRRGEAFWVIMLDLDWFKDVNDSLGHPAGDALLAETACRLKSVLRATDVLARLGGDEFAILQSGGGNLREEAAAVADRIVNVIAKPYEIDGSKMTIGTSIGIALAPSDGVEPRELLKSADLALYRQKSHGRNGFCFFDPQMTVDAHARHQLGNDLRNAIANDELNIQYQLVVDVRTRKACGVEALARWNHPQRGNIAPTEFIPLAEDTGLIVALGEWVLQKACADAAAWPSHIKVAVNLSVAQFKKVNLLDVIFAALVESGLPPERLELEITESVLIESHIDILPVIRQLKNIGVSIALDDFGTGYSSLSYLTMLPFDKIKIDKSFIANMTKRAECAAIVSSVLALGNALNIATTAEGVETEQQFNLLRLSGVSLAQGHLFGRPCPASELDFDGGQPRGSSTNAA